MSDATTGGESVVGKMVFMDLRIIRERAELKTPSFSLPLKLDAKVAKIEYTRTCNAVVYHAYYELRATDSRQREVCTLEYTLALVFGIELGTADDDLKSDAVKELVFRTAHPYLTEVLHNRSLSMGLPPLVLEIYKPPEPKQ